MYSFGSSVFVSYVLDSSAAMHRLLVVFSSRASVLFSVSLIVSWSGSLSLSPVSSL